MMMYSLTVFEVRCVLLSAFSLSDAVLYDNRFCLKCFPEKAALMRTVIQLLSLLSPKEVI